MSTIATLTEEEVTRRFKTLLIDQGFDEDDMTPEASFYDDIGADSLDMVEIIMATEEEFELEIPDEDIEKIQTIKDTVAYILEHAA